MDGENNGKPYEQMDDLGGCPIIFGSTPKCSEPPHNKREDWKFEGKEKEVETTLQQTGFHVPQKGSGSMIFCEEWNDVKKVQSLNMLVS